MISPERLRRYPFFGGLTDASLREIAMITEECNFANGTEIFAEGDPADQLYILVEGNVDLYYLVRDDSGRVIKEFAVGEINHGEPLGISAMLEPYVFTATARAASSIQALVIQTKGLRALAAHDPVLSCALMQKTAQALVARLHTTRVQLAAAQA